MTDTTLEQRFWANVERFDPDWCWEWTGNLNAQGYGRIGAARRSHRAHRIAYELLVGPIPVGLTLDHLCRNRGCVNPKHLEPVTQAENVRRGTGPTALNTSKTHCPKGHPYDEANTYLYDGDHRRCLTCKREHGRASMRTAYRRKKANADA